MAANLCSVDALPDWLHDESVHQRACISTASGIFEEAKIGIFLGSILSAVVAYLILRFAPKAIDEPEQKVAQDEEIRRDGDVKRIF